MHASGQSRDAATAPVAAKGRIRQAQEAVILQAAERVFARRGFAGATMLELAEAAGLPKSTLHYYFATKAGLYRAVLANTLALWLAETDVFVAGAEPAIALGQYIRAKMLLSASRPDASRVFANELLHGAPEIGDYLRNELRQRVRDKTEVVDGWIRSGRMANVDSTHLFFTLWATTQTYADFAPQVQAVLGAPLDTAAFERATQHVTTLILRGCGLAP